MTDISDFPLHQHTNLTLNILLSTCGYWAIPEWDSEIPKFRHFFMLLIRTTKLRWEFYFFECQHLVTLLKTYLFFFLSTVFYARNKRNPRVCVLNDQKNSHSGKLWLLEICRPIREWSPKTSVSFGNEANNQYQNPEWKNISNTSNCGYWSHSRMDATGFWTSRFHSRMGF